MATENREVLICDWHPGVDAVGTVRLKADRAEYLIDVCADCMDELTTLGRPAVKKPAKAKTNGHRPRRDPEIRAIRSWAKNNGFTLADRGRIPAAVFEAYAAR